MSRRKAGASKDAPVFFEADSPRWGLCCQFLDSPIRFRQATHRYCSTLDEAARRAYLSEIVLSNAVSLIEAIQECVRLRIGAFRITSQLLPLATHPVSGYSIDDLDQADVIRSKFIEARKLAESADVRLSFHPDQFVVLNSESAAVVAASVTEMNHQATIGNLVGAKALTLHGGGKRGGTEAALERLARGIESLDANARALLVLENDDRVFTPAELLPFCESADIPFVYDVHHHRCLTDGMSAGEATERAIRTWHDREPWMHISSPKDGWGSANPRMHSAFIDPNDVPNEWQGRRMTIDVEAKDKERAVIAISEAMRGKWRR